MASFVATPEVAEVLAGGPTKSTVRLKAGLNADLRVAEPGHSVDLAAQMQRYWSDNQVSIPRISMRSATAAICRASCLLTKIAFEGAFISASRDMATCEPVLDCHLAWRVP